MNQNFYATQSILLKILANKGGQPQGQQLPQEPIITEDPPVLVEIAGNSVPIIAAPNQQGFFT